MRNTTFGFEQKQILSFADLQILAIDKTLFTFIPRRSSDKSTKTIRNLAKSYELFIFIIYFIPYKMLFHRNDDLIHKNKLLTLTNI